MFSRLTSASRVAGRAYAMGPAAAATTVSNGLLDKVRRLTLTFFVRIALLEDLEIYLGSFKKKRGKKSKSNCFLGLCMPLFFFIGWARLQSRLCCLQRLVVDSFFYIVCLQLAVFIYNFQRAIGLLLD